MIVPDSVLETEMSLGAQIVSQIGVRNLVPVQDDGFSSHQVHEAFYQQTYQQLL